MLTPPGAPISASGFHATGALGSGPGGRAPRARPGSLRRPVLSADTRLIDEISAQQHPPSGGPDPRRPGAASHTCMSSWRTEPWLWASRPSRSAPRRCSGRRGSAWGLVRPRLGQAGRSPSSARARTITCSTAERPRLTALIFFRRDGAAPINSSARAGARDRGVLLRARRRACYVQPFADAALDTRWRCLARSSSGVAERVRPMLALLSWIRCHRLVGVSAPSQEPARQHRALNGFGRLEASLGS
jgi:hypothetical protein